VTKRQTVTVSYTTRTTGDDSGSDQDAAANDAIKLTNQSVTNNTPDITAPVLLRRQPSAAERWC